MVLLLSVASSAAGSDRRLVEAVKHQQKDTVRALLKEQVDVNTPEADGATALHWAAFWNDWDTASALIRAGAHPNTANDYGVTPLSLACSNASPAMVETLLKAGANPNAVLSTGETILMTCARTGNVDAVNALLVHGANVNAKEPWQDQTALMWAVAAKHAKVAETLIAHRADIHARSKVRAGLNNIYVAAGAADRGRRAPEGGFTPLLFAAREGSLEAARMLIAAGADVNEAAADGSTPLLVATVRGHVDLVSELLDQGADPNADGAGYTALHWAAGAWETELTGAGGIATERDDEWRALRGLPTGKLELVNTLLARGANPNAQIVKTPPRFGFGGGSRVTIGATPFLLAAMAGDTSVMRVLVAGGADPGLATKDGTTPVMVAAGFGRFPESTVTESRAIEAVALALELGGDVNAVNAAGDTALHGAASISADETIRWLVDHGARVNVKNKRGQTPLTVALGTSIRAASTSTVELLRKLGGATPEGSQVPREPQPTNRDRR
jgi:ankyrin repeat protein